MAKKPRPLPGSWVDAWCQASDLSTGSRVVLFALANYMDRQGVCWPSLATLARDTGMQRRSVWRALDEAEAAGWIEREKRRGPKGEWLSSRYRAKVSPPLGTETHLGVGTEAHQPRDRDAPRRSIERPEGTSTTELTDSENPSSVSVEEWETIIEQRDPHLLASRQLNGLTPSEATWLFLGLRRAEADEYVATPTKGATELVATVLRDMTRKRRDWSRDHFLGFVLSAAFHEMDQTGHGEPDADIEDAVRRAWATLATERFTTEPKPSCSQWFPRAGPSSRARGRTDPCSESRGPKRSTAWHRRASWATACRGLTRSGPSWRWWR